jgi:hypothetical protein
MTVTTRKWTRSLEELSMDEDVIKTANRQEIRLDEMEHIHPKKSRFIRRAADSSEVQEIHPVQNCVP